MGYTHYWTHRRRFTNAEWLDVKTDLAAIVAQAELEGVAIGDGIGDTAATVPDVYKTEAGETLAFNGVGEGSHETFAIYQNRRPLEEWQDKSRHGWDFCKTARKAYDVAVTACLVYLESVYPEKFEASSDGTAAEWEAGLALARRALPRLDNVLRIPREIEWESQFRAFHHRGGNYMIGETLSGDLVIADEKARRIIAKASGQEAIDWTRDWLQRHRAKRQRKLPCACKTLDQWEARQTRAFIQVAPSFGYFERLQENA